MKPTGPLKAFALTLLLALASPAIQAAERAIDKEVVIAASVEQAWEAWTTREGITSFFAPDAQIEPRVGGAFHIYFNPYAQPGLKGADDMRYMALQPKRMLSFDWNAPPTLPQARGQHTFVVVRFAAVGERQTRVTLHHVGWGDGGDWDRAFAYFDKAWDNVLGNLRKRFDEGKPFDWTPWLQGLKPAAAEGKK